MSPVHYAGGEIDQVTGIDGEEIRRHELTDGTITIFPFLRISLFDDRPTMNRCTLLLVRQDLSSQSSPACIFRSGSTACGKGIHYPACAGLLAQRALFDNAEILINVFTSDARATQA